MSEVAQDGAQRRRSLRLRGYDYGQAAAYFVTICTHERVRLLGDVADGAMLLNAAGNIIHDEWQRTASCRSGVELDVHVVMPNHVHGIILLDDCMSGEARNVPVSTSRDGRLVSTSQTLGSIVRGFKAASTRRVRESVGDPAMRVWQRNYFEHVVRSEEELQRIREYIVNNPRQWELDRYHAEQ